MKYLFIVGTPRSGTTAMWQLLASDERIIIGVERYGKLFNRQPLTVELFNVSRFSKLEKDDTFYNDLIGFNKYYKDIESKFSKAQYVGDKIPLLYMKIESLMENIKDSKIVFMLRNIYDVASSYEARAKNPEDPWHSDLRTSAAIRDWRNSLNVLNKYLNKPNILPVIYEDFFFSNEGLDKLYKFLGMEPTELVRNELENIISYSLTLESARKRELPVQSVMQISMDAPFGVYREIVSRVRNNE